MDESSTTTSAPELQRIGLLDTSKRASNGIFVYVALWLAICLTTGLQDAQPELVMATSSTMVAIGLIRIYVRDRWLAQQVTKNFQRAYYVFVALTLANTTAWGALTFLSIRYDSLHAIELPMTLSACGIAAAGTAALAINRVIRRLLPTTVLFPMSIAWAMSPTSVHVLIAVLTLIFVVYIWSATRVIEEDYWRALSNGLLLEERAQELERLSMTDTLTGLRNRVYFNRYFETEWKRAYRNRHPLTVLMIDLDHFKRINDTYGHPVGDRCLCMAAIAMSDVVKRTGDAVARYGGEEFIVLLSNTDAVGGERVARNLLTALRTTSLIVGDTQLAVTCSIGIASMIPATAYQDFALISSADKALYEAKHSGRDQLALFPTDGRSLNQFL